MKKILFILLINLILSGGAFACNYSDGLLASFSKEHKICSSYAKNKAEKLNLDKWEKGDLYHDCRCDLYMAELRNELGRAMIKYEKWVK
jgi:hypothetical protein